MVITKEQVKDFDSTGFIILRDFFSMDIIEKVSAWISDLELRKPKGGDEAKYYEISRLSGEKLLVRIENIFCESNKNIETLFMTRETRNILEALLGEPPVLFKDKINFKLPGCRPDYLHQDHVGGWSQYSKNPFITMMIAVDKNTEENAAVSLMKSGNYSKKLITEDFQTLSDEDPRNLPSDEYLLFEANPGDVVFFDSYLPHGSPSNDSNHRRRNIFLTFNRESDGNFRQQYYEDKWKHYPPNDIGDARSEESYRV